ncbi:FAD/NAD(P)-binding domain-containing protein [Hypoxylon sp. EC38]|nr:FAD/NAD(P)-binding domain-containing protein [Hypoxylon sp. EC38]
MDDIGFRAIIVGAGPVGLYMAHAMQRANIDFMILEQRRSLLDPSGQLLFVWPQTVRLFDQIGLLDPMQEAAAEVRQKKRTYGVDGRVTTTSNFWDSMQENHGYPFLTILRSDLVRILCTNLKCQDTCIKTNAQVVDITTHADGVSVKTKNGGIFVGSIAIGADGVHSETRGLMQKIAERSTGFNEGNPMLSTFYGIFGRASIAHLSIEPKVLYESRGAGTVIQCTRAKQDLQFVTLTPLPQQTAGRTSYTKKEIDSYAGSIADIAVCPGVKFGDIWQHADKTTAVLVNQEEGFLKSWYHDRIALVGDAVHKSTSVNGLGMTCGLHSAAALANELQSLNTAIANNPSTLLLGEAFSRYQQVRESECKKIWSGGYSMIREATSKSWTSRLWDAYILPWIDMENFARGILISILLIRHGQLLSYVPFESKNGRIPWAR